VNTGLPRPSHLLRCPKKAMPCAPGQLPVHSAHIGQEVEVHYRWHPLYGRRVKVRDVELRGGSQVVHIDAGCGTVRMIAGWMLDAAACSCMELGDPRVTIAALCSLHQLLVDRRLRGNSPDDSTIVREKRNGQAANRRSSRSAVDTAPDEHDVRHRRASGDERGATHQRTNAIRNLATLLMQAAGIVAARESDDDEH
jgi:hypothetical protein